MWTVRHRSSLRGQGGFTLIELLIVVAILGILGGVVALAMGGLTGDAKQTACEAERTTIESAIEAYNVDHNSYPATLTAMVSGGPVYLRSASVLDRWNYTTTPYALSGTGKCVGH